MWFGLNSQMAHSNNLMITMDNQLVIMRFTGYLGAKTYKYDSGSYVFSDYDAKDAIYKRTLQCPLMTGVKVVLTMVGACQMHCSTICIILKRLYMMQSLKTNYHVKRLARSLVT